MNRYRHQNIVIMLMLAILISTTAYAQVSAESDLLKLYEEEGDSIIWYLESKLSSGTVSEKKGVIAIFREFETRGLIPGLIESITDTTDFGCAGDMCFGSVSENATSMLSTLAQKIGAKFSENRQQYRERYMTGLDMDEKSLIEVRNNWRKWWEEHEWLFK